MPVFRVNKAFRIARGVKVFLNLRGGLTRGVVPDLEHYEEQAGKLENVRRLLEKRKRMLESKEREISQLKKVLDVAKGGENPKIEQIEEQADGLREAQRRIKEQKKALKGKDREIFQLENELRTARETVGEERRLPTVRFGKAFGTAGGAKVFLNLQGGLTRGALSDLAQPEEQAKELLNARRCLEEQEEKVKGSNQEINRLKNELRAAKERVDLASGVGCGIAGRPKEQAESLRKARRWIRAQEVTLDGKQREVIRLKNELRATRECARSSSDGRSPVAEGIEETGTLPDFVIIGAGKCGTTSLYDLLTRHPQVERAALKEPHFFDYNFDKGVGWYRSQFSATRCRDGRRCITGEATPYLSHSSVPERMAAVVPRARLIVLLRNPVDRVYSVYHREIRHVRETRRFKEALEASPEYLTGSIYVDQLSRWSEFFDREQMLVLKSEDFFKREPETLRRVLRFLSLPDWEPEEGPKVRNKGRYSRMDPATRRYLEEYFEPHNRRLYEYLGVDYGW